MRLVAEASMVTLVALAGWAGTCAAQSGQNPAQKAGSPSDSATEHFKTGMKQIGDGAQHLGEGIKQGAIDAWEAVKAGASAASEKLHETQGTPKAAPSAAPSGEGSR
ncbi:MAG: hypothetical protein ACLQJR_14050 [Stellaceae bacterium]